MKTKTFSSLIYTLILIITTTLLLTEPAQAQWVGKKTFNFGTLANNSNRIPSDSIYIDLEKVKQELGITKIDSMQLVMVASGEIDIDSADVYFGTRWQTSGGLYKETFDASPTTFTVTLNLADGVTGREELLVTGAGITSTMLRGVTLIKVVTRGATSGNDITDTGQDATLEVLFYGS